MWQVAALDDTFNRLVSNKSQVVSPEWLISWLFIRHSTLFSVSEIEFSQHTQLGCASVFFPRLAWVLCAWDFRYVFLLLIRSYTARWVGLVSIVFQVLFHSLFCGESYQITFFFICEFESFFKHHFVRGLDPLKKEISERNWSFRGFGMLDRIECDKFLSGFRTAQLTCSIMNWRMCTEEYKR